MCGIADPANPMKQEDNSHDFDDEILIGRLGQYLTHTASIYVQREVPTYLPTYVSTYSREVPRYGTWVQ